MASTILSPTHMSETRGSGILTALEQQPADALLALIGAFRSDARADKIDVGVGVFREEDGTTPVMRAVKAAEHRLVRDQRTKAYMGPEGDIGFFEALQPLIFGASAGFDGRLCGLQTPGGTGALRLACELVARGNPRATVWLGLPSWPNHPPIIAAAHLATRTYRHFEVTTQRLTVDEALEALAEAQPGDVALLHGCCHNPTGADFGAADWTALAETMRDRGVLPLIDLAYQGLGEGMEGDARGLRTVLDICGEVLVAYSCDKNFGLYRERVGALFALTRSAGEAKIVQSNLLSLARANWSMPPAHGAAIVRTILEDGAMTTDWSAELDHVRTRIADMRTLLAAADPALSPLATQHGMFSMLPLSPDEVARLRAERGIYMPSSGRINIAGLTPATVPAFVEALAMLRSGS